MKYVRIKREYEERFLHPREEQGYDEENSWMGYHALEKGPLSLENTRKKVKRGAQVDKHFCEVQGFRSTLSNEFHSS